MNNYDEELLNYIKNVNFNNKIIYDIGSNEGEIINFINYNSNNSKIFGIEPHPNNIITLNNKFKNNDNIKIIHGAVNTYNGFCKIGLEQQQRTNGLQQGHIIDNDKLNDMQSRIWERKCDNIPCFKLDTLCKDANIIKMDIEGFEHNILKYSLDKLTNLEKLLIEIHSWEDINLHGWTINLHSKENDSLNKMLNLFYENEFNNIIVAKTRNGRINKVNKNTMWTDIPICSYKKDGKIIYYKVVNLIVSKI
jgi:FkbM family methyltransferase